MWAEVDACVGFIDAHHAAKQAHTPQSRHTPRFPTKAILLLLIVVSM